MQALAKGMLGQDGPELATLDRHFVVGEIALGRNEYYAHRLGKLAAWREALAAVIDLCGEDGAWENQIDDAAASAIGRAITARPHLVELGMTPLILRETMMHSGLLHPVDGTGLRFVCPISSMRAWLNSFEHRPEPMPDLDVC